MAQRRRSSVLKWLAGVGAVAALVVGSAPFLRYGTAHASAHPDRSLQSAPGAHAPEPDAAPTVGAEGVNLRHTVTVEVVRRAKNAVVYISTERVIAREVSPFGQDPFFGPVGPRQTVLVPANSLGSGFIIHESGYIVTNNHVINRARKIQVQLADDKKYDAELVSADPDVDLAILKINAPEALPVLPLGDSSDLMIGEPVIAVGNPLGYSYSVSTGIVSAIHREIQTEPNKAALSDLIQTDAAINPGNSGGPLLNAYGQVIGINTAIRTDAQNIGFAIQVNRLRDLIPELMDPAKARKLEFPVELVERRTIAPPATVTQHVELVTPAGNRRVETINGRKPRDIVDAYAMLLGADARSPVRVATADGETLAFTPKPIPVPDAIAQARKRLGVTVEPVSPALAEKFGLRIEDGMLVTEVVKRSIGEKAQLQPGDVIFQLGRYRVRTLDEFGQLISQLPAKGNIRIGILRGDAVGYGVLQL